MSRNPFIDQVISNNAYEKIYKYDTTASRNPFIDQVISNVYQSWSKKASRV